LGEQIVFEQILPLYCPILQSKMSNLSSLYITQYKNYNFAQYAFNQRIVGICGLNGKGKTNLLDAIYYLCFTKSYFTKVDSQNTQFNTDGFRLEGQINNSRIICVYKGTGKKEMSVNDVPYSKLSQHIGKFPAVMIAPDDTILITGGSEERRKYIDTIISQIDAEYLQQLIIYNKVLQQRNSLLKQFAEKGKTDWALLEVIDEQLIVPGKYIFEKRKAIAADLIPLVVSFYTSIASNDEVVELQYQSQLFSGTFESVLNQYREKDFLLQRSNGGIHKDELDILLNGNVFKNIASQGQRKSLLFALKLAEFELLKKAKNTAPILLLDDVFEKLDDNRMHNLLEWVCNKNNGQVFITDTHKERLHDVFTNLNIPYQIIELS
jgi:DNA replication and repair protein RecF